MIWKYLHIKTTKLKSHLKISGTHSHSFATCLWCTTNPKEIWWERTQGQYVVHTRIKRQGFPFCYMCFKTDILSNSTTKWQQILLFYYHVLFMKDLQKMAELLVVMNTNKWCLD
jgi:hypothetical protein